MSTTQPLTILSGLPGTGKSKRLIEAVNAARASGRRVATFACAESPWMQARESVRVQGLIGCRQPGLLCGLDHFVSTPEAIRLLASMAAGELAAFEEAHYFGPELADAWVTATRRGVEVLIGMPSVPQRASLDGCPRVESTFVRPCEICGKADATTFYIVPGKDATELVCGPCHRSKVAEVRAEVVRRLEAQAPYPGQRTIYQPVELEQCREWQVLRPDSQNRVEIMKQIFREQNLLPSNAVGSMTYLDVGCNTGFFCHAMRQLGFHSEGVDVVREDILVAQMLDSFVRRDRSVFVAQDAYAYLSGTQQRMFDVTSAFAVFQWLMIQTSAERGIKCLEWLFAKTRRVCFLEMGYSAEAQYKDKLPLEIDRAWVERIMRESGGFAEVRVFPAGAEHGLSRDLFVGIKPPDLADLTKAISASVARGSKVLVVSKGDDWLLKLESCEARHFPEDATKGGFAGYHPENGAEALELLRASQREGADYLAFPPQSLWWLEYYGEFKTYLERFGRLMETSTESVVFKLPADAGHTENCKP